MSKKEKFESKEYVSSHKGCLFFKTGGRNLVSISDFVILNNIPIVNPVLIDSKLFEIYYQEGDYNFKWLQEMLGICGFFINYNNTDLVEIVFQYENDSQNQPHSICCHLEMNEDCFLYYVLSLKVEPMQDVIKH